MHRTGWVLVGVLAMAVALCASVLCASVLCAGVRAESASVLLQEGVYEQDVTGNLDRAMEVYQQVIKDAASDRRYVAEAHYRLGMCYLNKGDRDKAQEQFRQVVEGYADQAGLAAAARTELAKLAPPAPTDAQGLTFGPVVEQSVEDRQSVDFDSGKVLERSKEDPGSAMGRIMAQAKESGADAFFFLGGGRSEQRWTMVNFGMSFSPRHDPDDWSNMSADALAAAERRFVPGVSLMQVLEDPPQTMAICTQAGGLGLLQIVSFNENPKSVTIRYKMVKAAAPSAAVSQRDRADLANFAKALEVFDVDVGRYPTTEEGLEALVTQPAGLAAWRGPYVKLPSDSGGFGRYSYSAPGANGKPFELGVRGAAAPAGTQGLTFGGVVEMTLEHTGFVDFGSAKVLAQSDEDPAAAMGRIIARGPEIGADAYFGMVAKESAQGYWMVGFGMATKPTSGGGDVWSRLTADAAARMLPESVPRETAVHVLGQGKPPETMLFRTQKGGLGILQIEALADNPQGIKIRYKMAQGAAQSAALPPTLAILLPDVDTSGQGLDLDRGELVKVPKDGDPLAVMAAAAASGVDLVYDNGSLVMVEGTEAEKTTAISVNGHTLKLLDWAPGNVVTTREGNRFEMVAVRADATGAEIAFRALGSAAGGASGQPRQSARLTDLRLLLADAQAELKAKDAGLTAAKDAFDLAKRLSDTGRIDTASVERAQVDLVRISAEDEAARQKVDILTKEIARLESQPWHPADQETAGASTATQLADLRIRLADAQAELKTKEAERSATEKNLDRTKKLGETGNLDTASVERAQVDAVRAFAGYVAARQKVDILTQEVARLEATVAAWAARIAALPKRVTLGDVDHSKPSAALDLASGKMILLPPNRGDKEDAEALKTLPMGDVLFGNPDEVGPILVFLRGASPDAPDGTVPDMPGLQLPFKKVSGPWPVTFRARVADGTTYAMTVLQADDKSCLLEYWGATPQPSAATQVAVPAAPKKITLLDVDKSPSPPAALDLASGELVVLPKEKSAAALVNLGKGDVVFTNPDKGVPVLAFLRGASPDAPDGTKTDMPVGPMPYKIVFGPWPKTFAVHAADGKPYSITVLHADEQGCELEYSPAAGPVTAPALPTAPTAGGKP